MRSSRLPWKQPRLYTHSASKLVTLAPSSVGLFRYLLEGYDNLAGFTVINPARAILRLFYSHHQEADMLLALAEIQALVDIDVQPWPFETKE